MMIGVEQLDLPMSVAVVPPCRRSSNAKSDRHICLILSPPMTWFAALLRTCPSITTCRTERRSSWIACDRDFFAE
jgi:hypothetical protein